jgi:hypothetical protein
MFCLPVIENYFNIDLMTGGTIDFILSHLQIELIIRNGPIAIRTTIGKFLNDLLFKSLFHKPLKPNT